MHGISLLFVVVVKVKVMLLVLCVRAPKSRTNSVNKLKHVSALFVNANTCYLSDVFNYFNYSHSFFGSTFQSRVEILSYEVCEFHVRFLLWLLLLLLFFSVFRISVCLWCAQISFSRNRLKFGGDRKKE